MRIRPLLQVDERCIPWVRKWNVVFYYVQFFSYFISCHFTSFFFHFPCCGVTVYLRVVLFLCQTRSRVFHYSQNLLRRTTSKIPIGCEETCHRSNSSFDSFIPTVIAIEVIVEYINHPTSLDCNHNTFFYQQNPIRPGDNTLAPHYFVNHTHRATNNRRIMYCVFRNTSLFLDREQ